MKGGFGPAPIGGKRAPRDKSERPSRRGEGLFALGLKSIKADGINPTLHAEAACEFDELQIIARTNRRQNKSAGPHQARVHERFRARQGRRAPCLRSSLSSGDFDRRLPLVLGTLCFPHSALQVSTPRTPTSLANPPRWGPYAVMPLVRFCAGGDQQCSSLPRPWFAASFSVFIEARIASNDGAAPKIIAVVFS